MSFSDATRIVAADADVFDAELPESWGQGRTLFGGLAAGLALRAAMARAGDDRPVRSLAMSLVGPLAAGSARLEARVLRAGSSMTHVAVAVEQDGSVRASALVGLGAARPAGIAIAQAAMPPVPPAESLPMMPFVPGLTPEFTQHYDFRWTLGTLPFSGGRDAHVQGWIRPREGGPVDAPALAGLIDAWPPPAFTVVDRPIPGSSISWYLTIACAFEPGVTPGDSFWLFDSRSSFGCSGYSDVDSRLWDRDGRLVACSRQLFADFPPATPAVGAGEPLGPSRART